MPKQIQQEDELVKIATANLKALIIKTTNKCNLNCLHCAPNSGASREHIMSTGYIKKLIKQFAEIGGTTLILGGGEPFTRRDIFEILEFANELNLRINIETNGTLIDERILKLKDEDITFVISLDGIKPETHDYFRGVKGAFERTLTNIHFLLENGFRVKITSVLNRLNINEMEELIDYCVEHGMSHRLLPIITEEGRGASSQSRELALSLPEVYEYVTNTYLEIYRKYKKENKHRMLAIDIPRAVLPKEIETYLLCAWGIRMVGVNDKGDVGLCHYTVNEEPLIAGKINGSTLSELWFDSETFKKLREVNENTLKGICGNCIYASICRGLCRLQAYRTYRDIFAPNPTCQKFYELGLFPKESMKDPEKDCSYP